MTSAQPAMPPMPNPPTPDREFNKSAIAHPLPSGQKTSGWGSGRNHQGVDFAAPRGTPVSAAHSGLVKFAGSNKGSGYGIVVYISADQTWQTRYAHLSSVSVSVGDYVDSGDEIGRVGSTGDSTGNHLHFEILKNGSKVNPEPYLNHEKTMGSTTPDYPGKSAIEGLADIFGFFTNPGNWLRAGYFILGAALLIAGFVYFARGTVFGAVGEQIGALIQQGRRKKR